MRLAVKLLVLLLIVALVAVLPFLPIWRDGHPLVAVSDLKSWWRSSTGLELPIPDLGQSEPAVFYKWRDGAGQVHYSTEPPEPGLGYERVEIDPQTNTIPAVRAPSSETSD